MSSFTRLSRAGRIVDRPDGSLELLFRDEAARTGGGRNCFAAAGCGACGRDRHRRLPLGPLGDAACLSDGLVPGAAVELSVDRRGLARAAGLAFGVPLAGLLLGAALGHQLSGEAASMAAAVAGLVAGLSAARYGGARLLGWLELELQPREQVAAESGARTSAGAAS